MSYTLTDETGTLKLHVYGAGRGRTGVSLRLVVAAGVVELESSFDTDELHRAGIVAAVGAADAMHAADEARIAELERVIDDMLAHAEPSTPMPAHPTFVQIAVKLDRLAHWAAVRRGLPALESDPVASNETPPADVPSNDSERRCYVTRPHAPHRVRLGRYERDCPGVLDPDDPVLVTGEIPVLRVSAGSSWDRAAAAAARYTAEHNTAAVLAFNGELVPVAPFDSPAAITVRWDNLRHVRRG